MKKSYFLILMSILLINLVSASYHCSNESNFIEDQREIKIYETRFINGVQLGLAFSLQTSENKLLADLIVDAQKFSLSNLANLTGVEIKNTKYNLSLNSIRIYTSEIAVNGVSKSIDNLNMGSINNLEVFVFNINGAYPGEGSLEGIIGTKRISLSNEKPEIIKINQTDYLLELPFASNTAVIVKVKKCSTGNIIEIKDEIKNSTIQNTTLQNTTLENTTISSNDENISDENIITINDTGFQETNKPLQTNNTQSTIGDVFVVIFSITPFLILALYFWYRHNKKSSSN